MAKTIQIESPLGIVAVNSAPRFPTNSRLSVADQQAISAQTRELEKAVQGLVSAVRELQTKLDGATVG